MTPQLMPAHDQQKVIEVELPDGQVLKYPASMPMEQIEADARSKMEKIPTYKRMMAHGEELEEEGKIKAGPLPPPIGIGKIGPGKVQRIPPEKAGSDLIERVTQGGVQNDFRGRVTLEGAKGAASKPPKTLGPTRVAGKGSQSAYPSNINTQAGYDDIAELVLHKRPGVPTPVKFHEADGLAMRRMIDQLKRMAGNKSTSGATKRRSPK